MEAEDLANRLHPAYKHHEVIKKFETKKKLKEVLESSDFTLVATVLC